MRLVRIKLSFVFLIFCLAFALVVCPAEQKTGNAGDTSQKKLLRPDHKHPVSRQRRKRRGLRLGNRSGFENFAGRLGRFYNVDLGIVTVLSFCRSYIDQAACQQVRCNAAAASCSCSVSSLNRLTASAVL